MKSQRGGSLFWHRVSGSGPSQQRLAVPKKGGESERAQMVKTRQKGGVILRASAMASVWRTATPLHVEGTSEIFARAGERPH